MAQRAKAFPENAPGPFFVDTSCIDCGTCYTFAPEVYRDADGHSAVHAQPADPQRALMSLLACPTGSIGTDGKVGMREALAAFPSPIEDEVSWCGFTSEDSYGAWSYFIRRPQGNVLMDSPRAAPPLLKNLAAAGGVAQMVLSHRDDVADHARFHEHFGCQRIAHADEHLQGLEHYITGTGVTALAPDLKIIPTPGHTAGSLCLLYRDSFLFTGDTLWWNPELAILSASKRYNWHNWNTQLKSLERLLDFEFRWVLPGHGAPHRAESAQAMRAELERGLKRLKAL